MRITINYWFTEIVILVEIFPFPIYSISLISTAFMNMDITSPIPHPPIVTMPALSAQLLSIILILSVKYIFEINIIISPFRYCRDSGVLFPYSPLGLQILLVILCWETKYILKAQNSLISRTTLHILNLLPEFPKVLQININWEIFKSSQTHSKWLFGNLSIHNRFKCI